MPYETEIQNARSAGISDDDIINHLSNGFDISDKIKEAKANKQLTSKDILDHLTNPNSLSGGQSTAASPDTYLSSLPKNPYFDPQAATRAPEETKFSVSDVGRGIIGGAAHTAASVYDLARRGMSGRTPGGSYNALPELPQAIQDAAAGPNNPSPSYSVGRIGEQMAEAFIPGAGVSKVGKLLEAAPTATMLDRIIGTSLANGAAAGATSYIQTDHDIEAAAKATLTGMGVSAGLQGLGAAFAAIPVNRVYKTSAFEKSIEERFREQLVEEAAAAKVSGGHLPTRLDDIVDIAVKDNIIASQRGLGRVVIGADKATKARDVAVGAATHGGTDLVDINVVLDPLKNLKAIADRVPGLEGLSSKLQAQIDSTIAKSGMRAAIPGTPGTPGTPPQFQTLSSTNGPLQIQTKAGIPAIPGTPGSPAVPAKITINDAQEIKSLLQNLVQDQFAEPGTGMKKVLEVASEGFMKAMEDVLPWLHDVNRDLQNRIILKNAIRNMITNDSTGVNAGLAGAVTGHNYVTTAWALKNAQLRQTLAVLADRAGKSMSRTPIAGPALAGQLPTYLQDRKDSVSLPAIPYRIDHSNAQR